MENNLMYQRLLEFAYSDRCNLSTRIDHSVISITEPIARVAVMSASFKRDLIPVSETPGGVSLVGLLEKASLNPIQEQMLWEVAEAKYISHAKGRINLVAEFGQEPTLRFIANALPQILANPKITFIGNIEASKIRELYINEVGEHKYITATILTEIAQGKIRPEELLVPKETLKRAREDFRFNVLIETVDLEVEPRFLELSIRREEILGRREDLFYERKCQLDRREARYLFPKSPFYKIPDMLENKEYRRKADTIKEDLNITQRLIDKEALVVREQTMLMRLHDLVNRRIEQSAGRGKRFELTNEVKVKLEGRIEKIIDHHRFSKGVPVRTLKEVEEKGVIRGIRRGM